VSNLRARRRRDDAVDPSARLEEIARLVGHSGTDVTEKVYRQELRPVIQTGARVIDTVFADVGSDAGWTMDPLSSVAVAKGRKRA
jgi:hypothetical protein